MPGPRPNFFESDLLLALKLIAQKELGRHKLAQTLFLTEASARSILARLKKSGFISSASSGHTLTGAGKMHLKKRMHFTMPEEIDCEDITVEGESLAFLLRGASDKIIDGLAQRDRAIIGGASGATTLIFKLNAFRFPRSEEALKKNIDDFLRLRFRPHKRDVLIIVSAPSKRKAFRGCASVLEGFLL